MKARDLTRSLLLMLSMATFPAASYAGFVSVGISVGMPPPPLPVYVQPPCPAPGYIWTPGYWAYADDEQDYYWVPGTWVYAPAPGLLWTPGYWSEEDGEYLWHAGYWAPHIGFYGGINYGYGYFGVGFVGGYWHDRDFYYNRAVANVTNVNVTNIYSNSVGNDFSGQHVSFNGPDGVHARPSGSELVASREPRHGWTEPQRLHAQDARSVPGLRASANHGRPAIAATARPDIFSGNGATAAHGSHPAASGSGHLLVDGATRLTGPSASSDAARHAPTSMQPRDARGLTTARAVPVHGDRPSWASPARPAPTLNSSPWLRSASRPVSSWQSDRNASAYAPVSRAHAGNAAQSWPARPAYPAATGRAPAAQWARPEPARANGAAWRPAPVPPARAYSAPVSASRWAEPGSQQRYAAPPSRAAAHASQPPRQATIEQRRNGR